MDHLKILAIIPVMALINITPARAVPTGDYDVHSAGDYDGMPVSSSYNQVNSSQANNNTAQSSSSGIPSDMKKMDPALLEAMMKSKGFKNIDPQSVETEANLIKAQGGKLIKAPSMTPNGNYIPGVVQNSNGTRTLISAPTTLPDSSRYGASIPKPPRAYTTGSPTGDTSNLQNTFKLPGNDSDDN